MKIVIDIPKEIYTGEKTRGLLPTVIDAISNGTPLPEGHGRLIDADEAIKILKSLGNREYRRKNGTIQEAEKMLRFDEYISTIIEADKESDYNDG